MSYVDGLAGVLAQITQIQSGPPAPSFAGPDGFAAVMQQVASGGQGAPGSANGSDAQGGGSGAQGGSSSSGAGALPAGTTDLSGSFGWPLEEDEVLSPSQLAALGTPTVTSGPPSPASSAQVEAKAVSSAAPLPTLGEPATLAGLGTPSSLTGASGAPLSQGQAVVADATKYLGIPYQWGGTNPATGLDCSGLVQDVFKDLGVSLPRTADEQSQVGTPVASLADAQPGDLLFFPGSDGTATNPGHVGIFIGNGQMIDAPYTGAVVRVEALSDAGTPTAIRRISGEGLSFAAPATPGTSAAPATPGTSAVQAASTTSTLTGTGPAAGAASAGATSAAATYASDFAQASATYGLPSGLLSSVANTESSYDPQAVSSAGAQGMMQLMPSTAASLGVDPFDPSQAIPGAASLLASYHQEFGSWSLALAAYNAGPNAVIEHGGVPPYPQTQAYVSNVLTDAGMEAE